MKEHGSIIIKILEHKNEYMSTYSKNSDYRSLHGLSRLRRSTLDTSSHMNVDYPHVIYGDLS